MIQGLTNAGASISLLAMSTPKHKRSIANVPINIKNKLKVDIVDVDTNINLAKVIINLVFSNEPYNASRFKSKAFERRLKEILANNTFSIVQLEGAYLYYYIPLIQKYHKGKIALRAHNVEHEIWLRASTNQKNLFKKWYFGILSNRIREMESRLISKIDFLIPITDRDFRLFKSMGYNGAYQVSPVGYKLNNDATNRQEENERYSIFHLGGLDWLPNQEGIIWFLNNCWEAILEELPSARFFIAGRNAPINFIKKIQRYTGVVYCGEINDSTNFIRTKGIMIVPILSGGGMRVKIVEGMALGKAIVSTPIGAEGIGATNGSEIIIASSPEEMSTALISLLTNNEKTSQIGKLAQQFAKLHFNNEIITQNLLSFYMQHTINGKDC
ncbi:MAG TPA: glycosyltransferase family 4 protein, partial [Tenuifilaceae bacterium]|nr:glycosyltransferase family 4 protein [Tenuifilaceae bacterium]